MAPLKDIHPRWQNESVEQECDLSPSLRWFAARSNIGMSHRCRLRGDARLPTHQQGFKVLGVPLGHPDLVEKFLEGKIAEHRALSDRIPEVPNTQ